jgi:hypothetical protein
MAIKVAESLAKIAKLEDEIEEVTKELSEQKDNIKHSLHAEVYNVLKGLGITNVGIKELALQSGNNLYVEYGWSCRGSQDFTSKKLPLSLFEAENPFEAAVVYKKAQEKAEIEYRIKESVRQAEFLKSKLEAM